jgi:hypothetical protein
VQHKVQCGVARIYYVPRTVSRSAPAAHLGLIFRHHRTCRLHRRCAQMRRARFIFAASSISYQRSPVSELMAARTRQEFTTSFYRLGCPESVRTESTRTQNHYDCVDFCRAAIMDCAPSDATERDLDLEGMGLCRVQDRGSPTSSCLSL